MLNRRHRPSSVSTAVQPHRARRHPHTHPPPHPPLEEQPRTPSPPRAQLRSSATSSHHRARTPAVEPRLLSTTGHYYEYRDCCPRHSRSRSRPAPPVPRPASGTLRGKLRLRTPRVRRRPPQTSPSAFPALRYVATARNPLGWPQPAEVVSSERDRLRSRRSRPAWSLALLSRGSVLSWLPRGGRPPVMRTSNG